MLTRDLLSLATKGITVNTSRSFLTMLGIIIGVGAVVLMTGIGKSMEGVILGQIGILGPRTIALWPGNEGPEAGASSLRPDFDAITLSDANALKRLETVTTVAPMMFVPGSARYGREEMDPRIVGSLPAYYANQNIELADGVFHSDADEHASRFVTVIGSDVAEDLFLYENPIGKRIEIANRKFTVIGVLKPVGTAFFQNIDDRIIVPLAVARNLTGRTYVDMVSMSAREDADIQLAVADVQSLLRQRHGIVPSVVGSADNDDFLVRTAEQAEDVLSAVSLSLSLFITMIAGISLVVGGIGIMTIMLVAVSERTREIGLRKAVGAKERDILFQFLAEAVFLTMLGGLIGIVLGLLGMILVAQGAGKVLSDYVFAVSIPSIALAIAMAGVTGVIFGLYPAWRAAKLPPITALRYE